MKEVSTVANWKRILWSKLLNNNSNNNNNKKKKKKKKLLFYTVLTDNVVFNRALHIKSKIAKIQY